MRSNLKKGSSFLGIVLSFFSCQRELFFDNIATLLPTAVYTFISGNDSCTEYKIEGIYKAGVAPPDTNMVTLKVNVSRPGSYKVSTSVANGISFRDSGNFVSAGTQYVVLKTNGIPADTGTYTFNALPAGCSFSIDFSGTPVSNSAGYLMDGSPNSCTGFNITGTYLTGIPLDPSLNYIELKLNVLSTGTYMIGSPEINNVSFYKSGSFTSRGNQTIRLEAHGKPVVGGNFSYTVGTFPGSCSFIITVAAGGAVASGAIDCSAVTFSGSYKKGAELSAANTVSIPVDVTGAGSYNIITTTINGCIFSGTGSLQPGNQLIVLTGSGIPENAGSFSFPVSLSNESCSFSLSFEQ